VHQSSLGALVECEDCRAIAKRRRANDDRIAKRGNEAIQIYNSAYISSVLRDYVFKFDAITLQALLVGIRPDGGYLFDNTQPAKMKLRHYRRFSFRLRSEATADRQSQGFQTCSFAEASPKH
jgi:hypothetical protein